MDEGGQGTRGRDTDCVSSSRVYELLGWLHNIFWSQRPTELVLLLCTELGFSNFSC